MKKRVLAVVVDDPDVIHLVSRYMQQEGLNVRSFLNGTQFLEFLQREVPDIVILDIRLPDINGYALCKHMRTEDRLSGIPIVILTDKKEEIDKILGFELGADDYVTRPFSIDELAVRVKAILRRKKPREEVKSIHIGKDMRINLNSYEVFVKGKKVDLTTTEFKILRLIAEQKGWVFPREKILGYLWGSKKTVSTRTIDEHIKNIRKKLGTGSRYIRSVRGIGYKIEE
jgi:DNA-binding response OmpR family regulator